MDIESLPALLNRISRKRVAVLGDFCLDVYWELDLSRSETSLETRAPTSPVRGERCAPGGAGNLAANLAALGAKGVEAFGCRGAEFWGRELAGRLEAGGVETAGLLTSAEPFHTLVYAKSYDGEIEGSRHDFGRFNALPDADVDRVLAALEGALPRLDAVVVNEQVPEGVHTPRLRRGLHALMEAHPARIFLVDSRHHSDAYPLALLKLNDHEALRLAGIPPGPGDSVDRDACLSAAERLYQKRRRPVFLTRGARGMIVWDAEGPFEIQGIRAPGKVDPVGAGDSALAGIAAALAAGAPARQAGELGNLCAAVTVRKLRQTGTAAPAEILDLAERAEVDWNPDLAANPGRAVFLPDTDFEAIEPIPPDFRPTHAIFDHDGTISTLREGWEAVMEPTMIQAILGPSPAVDEAFREQVRVRVRSYIDASTGVQTLRQMQGLIDLVREFGRVPEAEILDIHGYKSLYNKALMAQVRERARRLERGELAPEDFAVKNAIPFLHALHRAGVKLHLASGTDEADVKEEARLMGYADLFEGRIHGASGDVNQEAKRAVLQRLFAELGPRRAKGVVVFGDGPVELREARRFGALAIGVVSDEKKRFGVNPEKRPRLVRAGAQLLLPDYSRLDRILSLLRLS